MGFNDDDGIMYTMVLERQKRRSRLGSREWLLIYTKCNSSRYKYFSVKLKEKRRIRVGCTSSRVIAWK